MYRAALLLMIIKHVDGYNRLAYIKDAEDYMNLCMDGIYQKKTPGPGQPYGQVS